jgi:hypothetical protein
MTHPQTQETIDHYLDIVLTYLHDLEQPNDDMEDVLSDSFQNATFRNDVLTEQEEHVLIEQPYDPQCHTTSMCPILQSPFELNEPVTVLPCNHVFNTEAIRTWLKEHCSLCPLCRYNLKPVSPTTEPDPILTEDVEDEMPPLLSDTMDMPIENIFIYDYPIQVEPYVSFRSTDRNENDFTIYYNIYYRYRNNTLPTENTLLHIQD